MLSAENVSVRFGDATVLADVSVVVGTGEVTAVVGPNGAGKSTLLRVLNGMVEPEAGTTLLDGKPLSAYSRRSIARRITTVAQENETRFPMTVLEFVLAGRFAYGGAFGWETTDDLSIAAECLDDCGLLEFETRLMNELSGGERQRALLARAFATQAQILLLDEPTNNLDLSSQASMLKVIRERCGTRGASALVVTHDLNLVAEFSDRVLMIADGGVYTDGLPEVVLNEENIAKVFGLSVLLDRNPSSDKIRITPVFQ